MSRENVEVVRQALDAFARGEVESALALADPDLVSTRVDPDGAVYHGRDGFMQMLAEWLEGFSDWSYENEKFIDAGDKVVVAVRQSGRGAVSDVPVEGTYWMVYDLDGGMITRLAIFSDRDQALETAGVPG